MKIDPEILDVQQAFRTVENDFELLSSLVEIFLGHIPDQMAQLKETLTKKDFTSANREAHAIKGASSNIGAVYFKDKAFALEKATKELNEEAEQEPLFKLYSELEEGFQILKSTLQDLDWESVES